LGMDILTPTERARRIRAVSARDVTRIARRIFQKSRVNLAVVGPYKSVKGFRGVLDI